MQGKPTLLATRCFLDKPALGGLVGCFFGLDLFTHNNGWLWGEAVTADTSSAAPLSQGARYRALSTTPLATRHYYSGDWSLLLERRPRRHENLRVKRPALLSYTRRGASRMCVPAHRSFQRECNPPLAQCGRKKILVVACAIGRIATMWGFTTYNNSTTTNSLVQ